MKIIDATPPSNIPAQVVVMDRELAKRNPGKGKAFYLRIAKESGDVGTVDLDGAVTSIEARRMAVSRGMSRLIGWMLRSASL